MDVVLISPYSDIAALGVRGISAVLKQAGHRTRLIFLPYQFPEIEHRRDFMCRYSDKILDQVVELCRGAKIVGVSLMTNYFEQAATLTQYLRERLSIPVIWGGIHPTISPEECLDYCDFVCIGEGEHTMLEVVETLAANGDISNIANIATKQNGAVVKQSPRPVVHDLDSLPYFDYDMDDHHVLDQNTDQIIALNTELLRKYLTKQAPTKGRAALFYQTIASRGCPHNCSYCCWHALKNIYDTKLMIRRRSVKHIIGELEMILDKMPWFSEITFSDDSFLDAPVHEIEQFAQQYARAAQKRPFQCLAEPRTITRERMDPLVESGLANIQIGIQSGSERIKSMYRRTHSNQRIIDMGQLLNTYIPRIRPPIYDFILDNPWETIQDKYETLQLLLKMPPPFYLQIFRLTFFPGTGLFDKALDDNLISTDIRDIYSQQYNEREINYINLLYSAFSRPVPRVLLKALCSKTMIGMFHNRPVNSVLKQLHSVYRRRMLSSRKRHIDREKAESAAAHPFT
jgi:anaerobic magnesium-protoporphyrin IX monomethyl ester cyclase